MSFCKLFVTRLIINKIYKVQWVDFKLGNVLVSLHFLKTMGIGPFGASAPLFLRNGELIGHSPIRKLSLKLLYFFYYKFTLLNNQTFYFQMCLLNIAETV
jgi:hypothetical protein